jgi:hypothetical protein
MVNFPGAGYFFGAAGDAAALLVNIIVLKMVPTTITSLVLVEVDDIKGRTDWHTPRSPASPVPARSVCTQRTLAPATFTGPARVERIAGAVYAGD